MSVAEFQPLGKHDDGSWAPTLQYCQVLVVPLTTYVAVSFHCQVWVVHDGAGVNAVVKACIVVLMSVAFQGEKDRRVI